MSSPLHLYDKLLQFTLFQGMSHADLMEVVTHTKIGFHKFPKGKCLVRAGESCNRLIFLINGTIQAEKTSDNHAYRVVEHLSAPYLPEPERLFGIHQQYTHTYTTLTDVNMITIDKQEVMLLLETQLVFALTCLISWQQTHNDYCTIHGAHVRSHCASASYTFFSPTANIPQDKRPSIC